MSIGRLRSFVLDFATLLDSGVAEPEILKTGARLLGDLVRHDDWLPQAFAEPSPERYRQYLLHCDSAERFSVVSFVWGPGQATPVHNHTVWGLIGVLRGAEIGQSYALGDGALIPGALSRLESGDVEAVSPSIGDIHKVSNAFDDRASISIHVYGANIGAVERATFDAAGRPKRFISGYANAVLPNLWDRSNTPVAVPAASPTPVTAAP